MAIDWKAVLIGAIVYLAILWGISGDVVGPLGIIGGLIVGLIAALIGRVKSAKEGVVTGLLPGLIGGLVYGIAVAAILTGPGATTLGVTAIFQDGLVGAILGLIGGVIGSVVLRSR